MYTTAIAGSGYRNLPLSMLDESSTNPRRTFEPAKLVELAHSITMHGLIQPITVRSKGERFEVDPAQHGSPALLRDVVPARTRATFTFHVDQGKVGPPFRKECSSCTCRPCWRGNVKACLRNKYNQTIQRQRHADQK